MTTRRPWKTLERRAFSIVELLVVISIFILLISVGGGMLGSVNSSRDLTVAGHHLNTTLDSARQLAVTQNRYVQVRFYSKDGSTGNHVDRIGIFLSESPYYGSNPQDYAAWTAAGKLKRAERDFRLKAGVIIPGDAAVSNLLSLLRSDSELNRVGSANERGTTSNFVAFYYHPDGSTDFKTTSQKDVLPKEAYLSLVQEGKYEAGPPALPDNYFMVAFDPITGRTTSVRP